MNRVWLFLCFLCVPWVARGQSAYEWRYWFDDAKSQQQTGQGSGTAFSITADAAALDEGLHTIHVQIADTAGHFSPPETRLFYCIKDRTVKRLRYWFDGISDSVKTAPVNETTATIDVTALDPDIHFFYCQAEDASGNVSDVSTGVFYRPLNQSVATWSYWFDEDKEARQTVSCPDGPVMVDVSALDDGFHIIYQQVSEKTPSAVESRWFIKIPQTVGSADMTCICTVDEKMVGQQRVPANGGIISWDLDVNALPVGLHRAVFQVITATGAASTIAERFFVRAITPTEVGKMQCVYTLDNSDTQSQAGTMANGLFHFDLDVSQLEDGLHRIAYMLLAEDGTATPQQTAFFWKTPLGGNGIVQYDYWLNDEEQAMRSIHLDKRENPFKLISLLPVDAQPLRSKCFHFEVKNGQPMIYAKNDFHIRFYDTAGRCLNDSRQFVDYQVAQEVTDIIALNSGDCKTVVRPEENTIQWFKFYAEEGDTAAFKLSQAAILQVFAPSGKEVFKTSESTSVQWGGFHTWENGTYYVAVHDVTGSQSNMTLDYMHMDKYDVVEWDVHTVGNGGCSTITFKGNGFRDLYAVDLYTAAGDSIHSVDISHESDAETAVTFDFSGAELGVYDAVFHFTQEDKRFANIVTVEEAVDIELATNVSFPSSFLRGTSTTYTIKITNKGNMTAYNVPIYTYIMNKNKEDGISHIKFEGLGLRGLFDAIDIDSISAAEKQEIEELIEKIGDSHYFQHFRVKDENSQGDSIWVKCGYFFTNIAPHEIKTLRLVVTASEEVIAYISVPEDWSVFSKTKENFSSRALAPSKRANLKDKFCCYHEKIECYLDKTSLVADIVELVAIGAALFTEGATLTVAAKAKWIGCATSSLSSLSTVSATLFCDTDKSFMEKLKEQGAMNTLSVLATVLSCQPEEIKALKIGAKFIKEALKNWKSLLKGGIKWGDNASGFFQCRSNPQNDSNCPPDPPGGGSSIPYTPVDPNDIYGYLSDAGSKFMTDEVAKVNYTIEFENDTAFAQASAHTIVIRDTLDSRYFDLKSFLPTSVKIGEREAFLDEATDIKTSGSVTSFLKTIDMRPEINAIAQVEGEYRQQTGIAKWTFTSLDPMTMEPTDDLMQGILPVNYNGTSGIGEVMFEVGVKPNKGDGTQIPNRASIVFDYEEPILTPTWTNIVDATAPESHVTDVKMLNDSTATVSIEASDELSGPWRYDVYVQYGSGAWFKAAENVPIDTTASVKVYEGINHGFYAMVTDSAGNVEQKNAEREFTFEVFGSQVETNTKLQLAEGWNWVSQNQQEPLGVDAVKPKARRIVSQTDEVYKDERFGWTGGLETLLPTEMYKVQTDEAAQLQFSGLLFNAAFRSIHLFEGWNWIGYPVAKTMAPAEALAKLKAEEGDALIGQDGLATFSDGEWTGTLTELVPGLGYMYRSASDKNLFLNATAQASSRRVNGQWSMVNGQYPDSWTVDKRKYPNVMGMVVSLYQDGRAVDDAGEWLLGAFCGDECRGLAQSVGGRLMMNVYGQGGEAISFYAMHRESGEIVPVVEKEVFRADLLGSLHQPCVLNMGVLTGIDDMENPVWSGRHSVYDLQGRKVDDSRSGKGVYIVTDGQRTQTQKVVRR